jgi:hypothetical protein
MRIFILLLTMLLSNVSFAGYMGALKIDRIWLAGGGVIAQASTFEEFEKKVHKDKQGVYIVEGDIPIHSQEKLREYFKNIVVPTTNDRLIINTVNGIDDRWDDTQKMNLTYCVSNAFGSNYAAVVNAMNAATAEWENGTDINFIHSVGDDNNCNNTNGNVVFDVNPVVGASYLARAFFPSYGRATRNVLIDATAMSPTPPLSFVGILRHELGHTLGFRHEHTRPEAVAPNCVESNNWRVVTDYDSNSVMHYPQCNGTGGWALNLTQFDVDGARLVYNNNTVPSNTQKWADFSTNDGWTSQVVGDFNDDGNDDIANFHPSNGTWWVAQSTGSSFNTTQWEDFSTNSGWTSQVVGEFNGDGKDDIANFHPSNGTWWVATSTGSSFTTAKWADFSTNEGWTSQVVGDFNNDGKDDIANFHPSNGTWWVATSTGASFSTTKWADFSTNGGWTSQVVGDFNQDGISDIANFHPSNGTWWLAQSTGSSFSTTKWEDFSTNDGWSSQVAGDFNGDGKDDVANFHPSNGTWWLAQSNWSSLSTIQWADFSTNDGWTSQIVGDFNGDGKDDIANFHPSNGTWWVTYEN